MPQSFSTVAFAFGLVGGLAACGSASPSPSADGEPDSGMLHVPDPGSVDLGEGGLGGAPCDVCEKVTSCDAGTTTIRGKVYDPAGRNPLYNVSVYVPTSPLPAFTKGPSCGCDALYPTYVAASAVTDSAGAFIIKNAPAGTNIPLVVQNGKWRRSYILNSVTPCADNVQPDKSLRLPGRAADGDMPDIAISTGAGDSLECLPVRLGVDPKEYVPGGSASGHVHIFTGYGGTSAASPAPKSQVGLWDSASDLEANDVLLLSCESREPALSAPYQQFMVDYTSMGGRVFASHYEYAWFNTGPFGAANLASWSTGSHQKDDTMGYPADPVTTTVNGQPFPEGVAFRDWLATTVNVLSNNQLPVYYARHNADVSAANSASQAWLSLGTDSAFDPGATEFFTFDTPPPALTDGGAGHCGRVAYSSLHVSGGPGANEPPSVAPDYPAGGPTTVPAGCAVRDLTPQETALEFVFFDLGSCLIPVGSAPQAPLPR